uniref:Uncharacterized protein n=1 Tax=Eptatretus burgeri TaxID=7764 RepID=A0A8C4Q8U5_EPTBU
MQEISIFGMTTFLMQSIRYPFGNLKNLTLYLRWNTHTTPVRRDKHNHFPWPWRKFGHSWYMRRQSNGSAFLTAPSGTFPETLKNSQSLCSLDDDESPRNRLETIVSPGGTCSFSAGRGDVGCITVCSSSTEEGEEAEEDDDDDDHDPCNEIFQLDCQGLDVDEIEKN